MAIQFRVKRHFSRLLKRSVVLTLKSDEFRVKTNHFLLIGVKNAIIQVMNYSIFNFIKNHFLLNVMD